MPQTCKWDIRHASYRIEVANFTKYHNFDVLQLSLHEGVSESRQVFAFASTKEGVYSVDFVSSITVHQAFSICIAAFHGETTANYPKVGDFSGGEEAIECMALDKCLASAKHRKNSAASFVSCPPISPVARA